MPICHEDWGTGEVREAPFLPFRDWIIDFISIFATYRCAIINYISLTNVRFIRTFMTLAAYSLKGGERVLMSLPFIKDLRPETLYLQVQHLLSKRGVGTGHLTPLSSEDFHHQGYVWSMLSGQVRYKKGRAAVCLAVAERVSRSHILVPTMAPATQALGLFCSPSSSLPTLQRSCFRATPSLYSLGIASAAMNWHTGVCHCSFSTRTNTLE